MGMNSQSNLFYLKDTEFQNSSGVTFDRSHSAKLGMEQIMVSITITTGVEGSIGKKHDYIFFLELLLLGHLH